MNKNDKLVAVCIVMISIMIGSAVGIGHEFARADENGFNKITIYIFIIIVSAMVGTVCTLRIKTTEKKVGEKIE